MYYTFDDLIAIGDNDRLRGEFCKSAVRQHMASAEYRRAEQADEYYHKKNPTIEKVRKFYVTATGRMVEDDVASNAHLKYLFFRKGVIQHVSYILNKGIIMDANAKAALDPNIERKARTWAKYASVAGEAYAMYNDGKVDVFHMICNDYHPGFCPLYGKDHSELAGGIRFWYRLVDNKRLITMVLYEPDGYTEFTENEDNNLIVTVDKTAYITETRSNKYYSETTGSNYGRLPIVECYVNDCHESELEGLQEDIDAYDIMKSDFWNEIADLPGFIYTITNAGGMNDKDVAQMVQRLKSLHAIVVDGDGSGNANVGVTTQTIQHEAKSKMLEILKADLYDNAHLADMSQLSASQKTTQEIQAAYTAQDNYCGDMKDFIIDAIQQLCDIAGLGEQTVNMEFDKVVNVTETVNAVMTALPLIGDEIAAEILPMLNAEQRERVKQRAANEDIARITATTEPDEGDDE